MNASDVLHYGHDFVLRNLVDLPMEHWDTENVCGWWRKAERASTSTRKR